MAMAPDSSIVNLRGGSSPETDFSSGALDCKIIPLASASRNFEKFLEAVKSADIKAASDPAEIDVAKFNAALAKNTALQEFAIWSGSRDHSARLLADAKRGLAEQQDLYEKTPRGNPDAALADLQELERGVIAQLRSLAEKHNLSTGSIQSPFAEKIRSLFSQDPRELVGLEVSRLRGKVDDGVKTALYSPDGVESSFGKAALEFTCQFVASKFPQTDTQIGRDLQFVAIIPRAGGRPAYRSISDSDRQRITSSLVEDALRELSRGQIPDPHARIVAEGGAVEKALSRMAPGDYLSIGRGAQVDLQTTAEFNQISRAHLGLERQNDRSWKLYDPGTTNGTFLNGEKIEAGKACSADSGASVSIGGLSFRLP